MKARVMVAALATAGLLALTGCGSNPQVAAYVGAPDTAVNLTVMQSEVDAVANEIAATTSDAYDTGASFTANVMQIMIQSEIARVVAKDKAITVTDAQREAFYATVDLYPALAKNPVTAGFMVRFADASTILTDKVVATAFSDLLAKTLVRVNPRFGVWDDTKNGLVDGSTGSLSEAAPAKG